MTLTQNATDALVVILGLSHLLLVCIIGFTLVETTLNRKAK